VVDEGASPLPPFIIISAPGAVGKTALAKHIAAQKNYVLWDLGRLKLGDNSFVGTVAVCFGAECLPEILKSLNDGSVGFIFDAFDEAEILSGWQRIQDFLDEMISYTQKTPHVCLVLLARSETASLLSYYIEEKRARCQLLEIGYFPEVESRKFVRLQAEHIARQGRVPGLTDRLTQHKGPFDDALDAVFSSIYTAFSVSPSDAWSQPVIRSFLGYAPVLQAVATYVSEFTNFQDVRKRIGEGALKADGLSVASSIMKDLLSREQSKVVDPLKNKGLSGAEGWGGWDDLYSPDEQLERILLHVLKNPQATQVRPNGAVPAWLAEAYQDTLKSFLPQHPFLREPDFSGPAFRDYTFASLLKASRDNLRGLTRERMQAPDYVATPLLIYFYRADETELVYGDDVGFFYESFSSRDTVSNLSRRVVVRPPSLEGEFTHTLELYEASMSSGSESVLLYIREGSPVNVVFSRRLRNARLRVNGTVTLGSSTNEFEITDSNVNCQTLVIRSKVFVVQSSAHAQEVVLTAQSYQPIPPTINVQVRGPGRLAVSWPGARRYPWATYTPQFDGGGGGRFQHDAFLALRGILSWFRRDKKEDMARHRDLIRNAEVGQNAIKRAMLLFLFDRGILYEEQPLYKLNMEVLAQIGINYSDLQRGNETPAIAGFLQAFEDWLEEEGVVAIEQNESSNEI